MEKKESSNVGKRLIFATTNEGKMKEVRMLLSDLGLEVLSMKEAGLDIDVVEDGKTFVDNALIKARAIHQHMRELVLADDSGLEIDYLGKEPGVQSARYMGKDTPYTVKNQAIIEKLNAATGRERSARFVCAIAAVFPDGREIVTEGVVEGSIAQEPKGQGGFGYDPIFYLEQFQKTMSQLTAAEKNQVSHRGIALKAMKDKIRNEI